MKSSLRFLPAAVMLAFVSMVANAQSGPDWGAVEQALGFKGGPQPGGVFRIGMPRSDLKVSVQGVEVRPGFALGSYAAFRMMGSEAMLMGDLALLDEEVPKVMSILLEKGLSVTAVHNHLNEMSPHVLYMHYGGRGEPVQMAKSLREALNASGTPKVAPASSGSTADPSFDRQQVELTLGRAGRFGNGVLTLTFARVERVTEDGMELLPGMGIATVMNFQSTGPGKAAITGDFVLIASEVNKVARMLSEHGIQVTAVHNHALADTPRLIYMHFWANDDAVNLAQGLRAALDLTNIERS